MHVDIPILLFHAPLLLERCRGDDVIVDITDGSRRRSLPRLLDIERQGVRACTDHGGHHHIDREVP